VLYSADALGVGSVLLPDETGSALSDYVSTDSANDANDEIESPTDPLLNPSSNASAQPIEIVFIDSRVPDADAFIEAWASPNVQFVVIEDTDDALAIITQHLDSVAVSIDSVSTLRIVSHGGDGFLQLGNATIDQAALNDNAHLLAEWSDAMTGDADILLYGCNVAEGLTGVTFVETLANLTDADVAASNDITGNAEQGGDWDLEVSYGATSDFSPIDTQRMAEWTNTLARIEVSFRDDVDDDLDGFTSLSEAVNEANSTPEDDEIILKGTPADGAFTLSSHLSINSPTSGNLTIINETGGDVSIQPQTPDSTYIAHVNNFSLTLIGDPTDSGHSIIIQGGSASTDAGALEIDMDASLVANDIVFLNNKAGDEGGAIASRGSVTLTDSSFISNYSPLGGAIYVDANATHLQIINTTFTTNGILNPSDTNSLVSEKGGAIYSEIDLVIVDSSNFSGNKADSGGAIYAKNEITVDNSTFMSNTATQLGGAIFSGDDVTITNSHFENNKATANIDLSDGGAVYASNGGLIESSSFVENQAHRGSAIFKIGTNTLDINNSTFFETNLLNSRVNVG